MADMAEIELEPGQSVTIVCPQRITVTARPWAAHLLPEFGFVTDGLMACYDAPDGALKRTVSANAVIDVFEVQAGLWRVTKPPLAPLWVRAPVLTEAAGDS